MDVEEALEKAQEAKDYWRDIYQAFKDDVRFSIGLDHYPGKSEEQCTKEGLMIVPVLPQYIHQVVNGIRQNTPSATVIPGDGANPDTAEFYKDYIRGIEYKSKADAVYDTAAEYAVRGGFGYARIDHDYVSEDSFIQELKLLRVQNPLSVYLDPSYVELDGSDAKWGFVLDTISKEDFEKKYPGKEFSTFDDKPTEKTAEEITIAEFFSIEYEEIERQLAPDGSMIDPNGDKDAKTRKIRKVIINRQLFSGADELEKTTFPGQYIPIVPFLGEEVWVDGKRYLLSLIRLAKDAQRRVNKWASKESEILDMAPIAPVMAPYGAVDDFMDEWGSPGENMVLRYRTKNAAGEELERPERLQPPPIPTGIINAMEGAKQSVKEALGIYDTLLGKRTQETSGVAIDARKQQGEIATLHFGDNAQKSVEQIYRILICATPEVVDTARVVQTVTSDQMPKLVGVNGAPRQDGQEVDHDLTKGKYDVRVVASASYTTKKQEEAALLGDVIKQNPQMMMVIGDLWAKSLDVPGAEAMAERLKKAIPPQLTQGEDGQGQDPEKMQMQQALQQMQQQMQQMQAELQSKQADDHSKVATADAKTGELQLKQQEIAHNAHIEQGKLDNERFKIETDLEMKKLQLHLDAETLELERLKLGVDTTHKELALQPTELADDAQAQPADTAAAA